ncbi:unnamed protein product, partial [Meganyctiphanes norvegica]
MLRSGQYRLSMGSLSGGTQHSNDVVNGQFKSNMTEFSKFDPLNRNASFFQSNKDIRRTKSGINTAPDARDWQGGSVLLHKSGSTNTLHDFHNNFETMHRPRKFSDVTELKRKMSNSKQNTKRLIEKHLHQSCESLINPRGAVNRVEQRVKSLLQRSTDSKQSQELQSQPNQPYPDSWQYGHLITLPRRSRRSLALSNSNLNSFSDTASCLSASSGYSSTSSSSSNYDSFKSFSSFTSSGHKHSNIPEGMQSLVEMNTPPSEYQAKCTVVDNPLYDILGGQLELPNETSPKGNFRRHVSLNSLEELGLELEATNPKSITEDPIARRCREYFEQRLKNSENIKSGWLRNSPDAAVSNDNECEINSKSDAISDSSQP